LIETYRNQSGVSWDNEHGADIDESFVSVWAKYIVIKASYLAQFHLCVIQNLLDLVLLSAIDDHEWWWRVRSMTWNRVREHQRQHDDKKDRVCPTQTSTVNGLSH
jgi:hypothetical protein